MLNIRRRSKKIYTFNEERYPPVPIRVVTPPMWGNDIKRNSRNACWGCERAIQGKVHRILPNYNMDEIHYNDGRSNCVPRVRRLHRLSN